MAIDVAHKRYIIRTLAFMTGYAAVNIAAIGGAFDDVKGIGAYALALVVAAPVAGQLWATMALMNDADEYVRRLTSNRFVAASGLAMVLLTGWGFMESYANAPHVPG